MTHTRLSTWLFLLLTAALLLASCSDDSNSNSDGDEDGESSGPVSGELFLSLEGESARLPHAFQLEEGTAVSDALFYRTLQGYYLKRFDSAESTRINQGSTAVKQFDIGQYAVSSHFVAWNVNMEQTFSSRWQADSTRAAATSTLAPGMCITMDELDREVLVAARTDGNLYKISLTAFSDPAEISTPNRLFAPGNVPLSLTHFACAGSLLAIGATDHKLYKGSLLSSSFVLEAVLEDQMSFDLLQMSEDPDSGVWAAWVDEEGDIQGYNLATGDQATVNVDAADLSDNRVRDLRLSGSVVLFSIDSNIDGNYDLWAADLATMKNENDYIQVTNEPHDQRYPFLYDGWVYWEDNRNAAEGEDRWEIYRSPLPTL